MSVSSIALSSPQEPRGPAGAAIAGGARSNLTSAALWVGFWAALAYRLGQDVSIVPYIWTHLSLIAMVVVPLLLAAIGLAWFRMRKSRGADISRM